MSNKIYSKYGFDGEKILLAKSGEISLDLNQLQLLLNKGFKYATGVERYVGSFAEEEKPTKKENEEIKKLKKQNEDLFLEVTELKKENEELVFKNEELGKMNSNLRPNQPIVILD